MSKQRPKPLALIIMDGYGISPEKKGDATREAETPFLDKLYQNASRARLGAAGEAVGLPDGQMGNSEVGHLNLGAGRKVYQEFTRINKAIEDGTLPENEKLMKAIRTASDNGGALHLMGLLSDGGVHSHIMHLFGLLEMAEDFGLDEVYVHAILDGRDTPPQSALEYIEQLEEKMEELGVGEIATVSGRYYTMDRDERWDRTEKAYKALVKAEGREAATAKEAVKNSYEEGVNDEFVEPAVINPEGSIDDGDALIFFNFRADRARQITRALALEEFAEFERDADHPEDLYYVCMTEYDEDFDLPIAFPPMTVENGLGEILSREGLKQLRIAETEKYAHVTFFFNGGEEKELEGEERVLIPSPQIETYDTQPEMSAPEVTEKVLELIDEEDFDVIVLNFANPDMVGHTGDFEAAVKAVEAVDEGVSRVVPAILEEGGQVLLTADHGNSEKMEEDDGSPFTAHTTNPVPLFYLGGPEGVGIESGILADIAPTMLDILELDKPEEMTGSSLLSPQSSSKYKIQSGG